MERNSFRTHDGVYFFVGNAIELAVLQCHILYTNVVFQSINPDAVATLLAGDILQKNILEEGIVRTFSYLLVLQFEFQYGLFAFADVDVADVETTDYSSTDGIGLDAEGTVHFGTSNLAILHPHVVAAS